MNPPMPFASTSPFGVGTPADLVNEVGNESVMADSPAHLTFDEMRELPMHLALGFDIEGEQ